jgi:hypothetical protein
MVVGSQRTCLPDPKGHGANPSLSFRPAWHPVTVSGQARCSSSPAPTRSKQRQAARIALGDLFVHALMTPGRGVPQGLYRQGAQGARSGFVPTCHCCYTVIVKSRSLRGRILACLSTFVALCVLSLTACSPQRDLQTVVYKAGLSGFSGTSGQEKYTSGYVTLNAARNGGSTNPSSGILLELCGVENQAWSHGAFSDCPNISYTYINGRYDYETTGITPWASFACTVTGTVDGFPVEIDVSAAY